MRNVVKGLIAASLVAGSTVAATAPAQADRGSTAIVAGLLGLGVGAAIASDHHRGYYAQPVQYYGAPAYYGGGYGYGYSQPYYGGSYGYAPAYYGGSYGYDYDRGYRGHGGRHYDRRRDDRRDYRGDGRRDYRGDGWRR